MVAKGKKIWMDGALVDWDAANVHVLTHTLHYGLGVFEGIRCYQTAEGPAVFRLQEHVDRLYASAHISAMKIPFDKEEFSEAILETLRVNELNSGSGQWSRLKAESSPRNRSRNQTCFWPIHSGLLF